jgi:hypothetical protein
MRILSRGEVLAPTGGRDRAAHDLAVVRRLELQADLAALLTIWRRLILGIGICDLLSFAQLCIGLSGGGLPRRGRGGDDETAFEQTATRYDHTHVDPLGLEEHKPFCARIYFATSCSWSLETCQSKM